MGNFAITLTRAEVSTYYTARVPKLKQPHLTEWRGPCPIHNGTDHNFAVDPKTGLWFCHSLCGHGGDAITLEMALTGATWRAAVAAIELVIGRILLERPASGAERRTLAEQRQRERRDMRDARFFQIAAVRMAEHTLDDILPPCVPQRYAPTQFLLELRGAKGAALLAFYREFRMREPRLTAALVYTGERAWRRLSIRVARFVTSGMEVPHDA